MQTQSEQINEIAKALALAQSKMGSVPKDGVNPHFRSKYPTLESALNAGMYELNKNEIAVTFSETENGFGMCQFTHSSGQWMRNYVRIVLDKPNMQGVGSSWTYSRRYTFMGLAGLAAEDDDANAAVSDTAPKDMKNGSYNAPKSTNPNPTHPLDFGSIKNPGIPAEVQRMKDGGDQTFPADHKKFAGKAFRDVVTTTEGMQYALYFKDKPQTPEGKPWPVYVRRFIEYSAPFVGGENRR